MNKKILLGLAIVIAVSSLLVTSKTYAVTNYFNGFETDVADWQNFGGTITRVSSGTNGITSKTGAYHANITGSVFSRWGGYENVFPTHGYVTKLDVYLDMSQNPTVGTDKRFDFSSAINQPDGNHRRDFIFHVGTNPAVQNQWVVSASNNAPGWPANPDRNPYVVTQSGWYTLKHVFSNDGGVLKVTLSLLDSNQNELRSWVLSDPSDVIGTTVGGNRYGWFTSQRFDFSNLALDNAEKYNIVPLVGPPTDVKECKKDGWKKFNNPTFKNQGACVKFVEDLNKPTKPEKPVTPAKPSGSPEKPEKPKLPKNSNKN